MEILIISSLSIVLVFLSFIIGLHYGSKIKSGEIIEVPNPIRKVKEHKQIKKIEKN